MVSYCLLLLYHLLGLTRRPSDVIEDLMCVLNSASFGRGDYWVLSTRIKTHTGAFKFYIVIEICFFLLTSFSPLLHQLPHLTWTFTSPHRSLEHLLPFSLNGDFLHLFKESSSSSRRPNTAKKDFYFSPTFTSFVHSSTMDPPPKNPHWYCSSCGHGAHNHVTDVCCCECGKKRSPDAVVEKGPVPRSPDAVVEKGPAPRPPVQQNPPPK